MRNWLSLHPKIRLTFIVVISVIAGAFLFQNIKFVSPSPLINIDLMPVWKTLAAVISDSEFWKTVLPVLSVIVGIWLTSQLSHKRELHKDLRDRLMSATFDSLTACRKLMESLTEFGIHAPRGGGRPRPADGAEGKWEEIDVEEAAESDQRGAEAFTGIVKALDTLQERNLELSIVASDDLREAFEAIHHRVCEYLMSLDGMIKGSVLQQTMDDVEQLFEAAKNKSRQAIRSPKF